MLLPSPIDVDERWDTFVRLIHDDELSMEIDDFYPRREFVERVECLIRGMGDDARPVRWVMETLPQTINDEDYSSARELIAVSLFGVLRLKEAIPHLIAMLHDEDQEMVEHAVRSLSRIGGEAVIEALDRWFADADGRDGIRWWPAAVEVGAARCSRPLSCPSPGGVAWPRGPRDRDYRRRCPRPGVTRLGATRCRYGVLSRAFDGFCVRR